ncbi:PadR family transcriptional regulator [Yinghuangia seranimata]|uniref:PadR family transcriptional regulator n=1 Tax=Yinghuangia seranimata TaxID=408067 RepID=UPI00248BAD68|nr:PadR family transcriptional regulator [Yinghuangia seranimata]MDI2128896.1 PadR family transcriptional regulator [Yinghuangia seranimata]
MPNDSAADRRPLTTTSYAILTLLAVQPWTTYELAQQMDRSLRWLSPRSASSVYEEPKRLVAAGLADARKEFTGRRARTVYGITEAGRAELRSWLARDVEAVDPKESDLLRVAFADHGELDDLKRTLAAMRADAATRLALARERAAEYRETGGPYPDRLPVIALVTRMFLDQAEAFDRWAAWAEQAVGEWGGVTPATGARVPDGAFGAPE